MIHMFIRCNILFFLPIIEIKWCKSALTPFVFALLKSFLTADLRSNCSWLWFMQRAWQRYQQTNQQPCAPDVLLNTSVTSVLPLWQVRIFWSAFKYKTQQLWCLQRVYCIPRLFRASPRAVWSTFVHGQQLGTSNSVDGLMFNSAGAVDIAGEKINV